MNLKAWKKSGAYFSFKDKYMIFHQIAGTGEPLILIHGFPTSSWDWNKVWTSLTKRYKVYTLDMLGYGYSDKPRNIKYRIADQVDLWEAYLKDQNVNSFHILAHNYGDTVVQEMLARVMENSNYEFNIKSVCFLNGGMFPESNFPTFTQQLLLSPAGFVMQYFMGRDTLAKNFRKIFGPNTQASPEEIDEFWEILDYNLGKGVIHKLIKYLDERETYKIRWREAIQHTRSIPKRLINGGFDPISGRHMAQFYKMNIPDADVVVLSDIGHYPQVEAPIEVLNHYYKFRNLLY